MLILVVEDECLIALAMEWGLKIAGHRVLGPAYNVREAICLCSVHRPDFALIDLNLHDGSDAVDIARFLQGRYQTPCLFLSTQAVHARANHHLAWGLIRKPYDFASLPLIIDVVMRLSVGRMPTYVPNELELFDRYGNDAGRMTPASQEL